jgi:biotin carboxyl carrier protein
MSLLLSGCGGPSQEDLAKAKAAGASEEAAKQKDKLQQDEQKRLAAEVKKLQQEASKAKKDAAKVGASAKPAAPAPAAPAPRRGASCGGNLSVGTNTSCAFAANVESSFYAAGGGTNNIQVYSPVTGRYYTMRCVAGIPTVCRGGNNAVVYIR